MTIFRKVKGLSMAQLIAFGCHLGGLYKYDRNMGLYIIGTSNRKLIYNLDYMLYFLKNVTSIINCSILNYYDDVLFINCNMAYAYTFMEQCIELDMPYLYTKWVGGAVSNMRCLGRGGVSYRKHKLEGIWGLLFPPGVIFNLSGVYNKLSLKETRSVNCLNLGLLDFDDDFDVDHQRIQAHKYGYIDFPLLMNDDSGRALGYIMHIVSCLIVARRLFIRTYVPWLFEEEYDGAAADLCRASGPNLLRVLIQRNHGAYYHYYKPTRRNPRRRRRLNRYYTLKTGHGFFRMRNIYSEIGQNCLKTAISRNYWFPFFVVDNTRELPFVILRGLLCMWYQEGPIDRDWPRRRIRFRMWVKYHIKITYIMYRQFLDGYGRRLEATDLMTLQHRQHKYPLISYTRIERQTRCSPLVSSIVRLRLYYTFHPKNVRRRSFFRSLKLTAGYICSMRYHSRRKGIPKAISSFYYHYYSTKTRIVKANYFEHEYAFYKYTWTRREVYTMYNFVFDRIDPDFPEFTIIFDYWELDEEIDLPEPTGNEIYYYQIHEIESTPPAEPYYEYRYYFEWLYENATLWVEAYGEYLFFESDDDYESD